MIDFTTDVTEDFEKTQLLPSLTANVQLDEALKRERAARIEIVELMRQNLGQAKEIEQLRSRHMGATTEERLFEVCGALKDTLSMVLKECLARSLALNCRGAAGRALEDSCNELEQILSDPGFSAPATYRADTAQRKVLLAKAPQMGELTFRSISAMPVKRRVPADESRPARVLHLEVVRCEAKPTNS